MSDDRLRLTRFHVARMDCAGEERLIRMALEGQTEVHGIRADLEARELGVVHRGDPDRIARRLEQLDLGATMIATAAASEQDVTGTTHRADEARVLRIALAINAGMFAIELASGLLADSSALLADSLDMFADAAVYGIALMGVHRALATQLKVARLSGVLQLLLGLAALADVVRHVVFGSAPEAPVMVAVAVVALSANAYCLWLLARHRAGGAHMRASWIFTTNDVLANLGVILAAGLVGLLHSPVPDLVVGTGIALLVMNGARRILRLRGA
jgi:Co/Zn/Cd efflux system component